MCKRMVQKNYIGHKQYLLVSRRSVKTYKRKRLQLKVSWGEHEIL